jgi:predicted nicotinamide N-methyase
LDRADEFKATRLLDLGCGSGLAAVAAAKVGARSTGIDLDPLALDVARRMAAVNEVTCDWHAGDAFALTDDELSRFDLVVAGDLFYEDGLSKRALEFLERAGTDGRRVLVADPNRGAERMRRERRLRVFERLRVPVYRRLENVRERDVTVYAWEVA